MCVSYLITLLRIKNKLSNIVIVRSKWFFKLSVTIVSKTAASEFVWFRNYIDVVGIRALFIELSLSAVALLPLLYSTQRKNPIYIPLSHERISP